MAPIIRFRKVGRVPAMLVLFLLLCIWYAQSIPPFEGPDEPEHFAYVTRLAEGRGFPPQGKDAWQTPVRQESGQPPLYYLLASIPARLAGTSQPPAEFRPNPHFPSDAPGTLPDNKNVAIHYPDDTNELQGGWLALYLARAVSMLAGLVLLIATYGMMREVIPGNPEPALLAVLLLVLTPQVIFVSSLVSNDMLAAATAALTLWTLASLTHRGPSPWRGFLTGVAWGLALLCKASNLALLLPLSAAVVRLAVIHGRRQEKGILRNEAVQAGFLIFIGAILVAGWWYLRNWLSYGNPLGIASHFEAPWAIESPADGIRPDYAWREVFFSFWAAFGWGNIKFAGWVYYLLGLLTFLAMAGVAMTIRHAWRKGALLGSYGASLGLLALTLVAVSVALQTWMQRVIAPHGRLLFPALAAVSALLIIGWRTLDRRLPSLILVGMGFLTLSSPITLIMPAYALPAEPTQAVLAGNDQSVDLGWRFDQLAELEKILLMHGSVRAGDTLPVTLCWRAIDRGNKDYSVLLHIVGPDNRVVASRRTYPGLGSYPTSVWQPGRRFCDTLRVTIPLNLERTLLYKVELAMYDHTTGDRLPALGPHEQLLTHTFASQVRLVAASDGVSAPGPEGNDPISLVASDFSRRLQAGGSYPIALTWWTAQDLTKDYTVYIHFRDTETGANMAQGDGPPLDGWYPTSYWQPDEVVEDVHLVAIPADLEPSVYDLVIGWYDPDSGVRIGQEHQLGAVEVLP